MEDCGAYPGDIEHLLSTSCPALGLALRQSLSIGLAYLEEFPELYDIVTEAFRKGSFDWCSMLVDPSTFPPLLAYKQQFGLQSIFPVLKFSRSYIWCMHKTRIRLQPPREK